MFCRNCGNEISDGANFCDKCGFKVSDPEPGPVREQKVPGKAPGYYGVKSADPRLIGFSEVYHDPRIQEFKEKEKKSKGGCMMTLAFLVPLAVAVICIFGYFTGDNDIENAVFLVGLSLIPAAVLFIISLVQKAHARREKPMWEGVVTGKEKEKVRDYHAEKHNETNGRQYYTLYTIHVRTDDGKNKKFSASDDPGFYGYYKEGDRVRYHPVLEYYEKYDKSHDNFIFCACCKSRNPIDSYTCSKCGMPLFK